MALLLDFVISFCTSTFELQGINGIGYLYLLQTAFLGKSSSHMGGRENSANADSPFVDFPFRKKVKFSILIPLTEFDNKFCAFMISARSHLVKNGSSQNYRPSGNFTRIRMQNLTQIFMTFALACVKKMSFTH